MRKKYYVSILASLVLMTACSTRQAYPNRTGFLDSYATIEKKANTDCLFFEKMPESEIGQYRKILVPDIKVIPNTQTSSARENELYSQASAYATAAYRKNIIKNSANYEVVDVAQQGTLVMQMALSMVEVHPDDKTWDTFSALPFSLNPATYAAYQEGNARLLIEARITDAMSKKLLARSMRVVMDEPIMLHSPDSLRFSDFQDALDRWLNESVIRH